MWAVFLLLLWRWIGWVSVFLGSVSVGGIEAERWPVLLDIYLFSRGGRDLRRDNAVWNRRTPVWWAGVQYQTESLQCVSEPEQKKITNVQCYAPTYQASKSRGKRSGLLITERNRPEYSRDLRAKVGSDNRCQRKWCDTQWFLPSTTISHRRNHFSTRRLGHHRTELYRTKLITFP